MTNLPQEIIVDILSRLPVKFLCRFKCVSKPWRTLISDPHFVERHLHRNNNHNERIILISGSLYSIEYNEPSSDDSAVAVKLGFPSLGRRNDSLDIILGSCNGLLFVANEADRYFLLNPSTRESKRLPKSPFVKECLVEMCDCFNLYGMGCDSCTDDYKVVKISCHDDDFGSSVAFVNVYSLRTGSWRRIEDSPYEHYTGDNLPGVFLNGALHWLVCGRKDGFDLGMIASLDLADEKFRDVPSPGFGRTIPLGELGVIGGCLSVLVSRNGYNYEVSVMKEYGVRESWTKFAFTVRDKLVEPLCFPKKGEIMWRDSKKLVLYNPNEETYRDVVIRDIPVMFEAGIYVESLVSPNRIAGIDTLAAPQVFFRSLDQVLDLCTCDSYTRRKRKAMKKPWDQVFDLCPCYSYIPRKRKALKKPWESEKQRRT